VVGPVCVAGVRRAAGGTEPLSPDHSQQGTSR